MRNTTILFFGNFPPPNTGQTIVTQMNYGFLENEFSLNVINTSSNKFLINNSFFGKLSRIASIVKSYFNLHKELKKHRPDHLYIVASSSLEGHLRDWFTILIAKKYVDKITAHIHTGNFSDIFERSWHQSFTKKFIGNIGTFVFLSESLSKRTVPFIKNEQINIIPNTVDKSICCMNNEVNEKVKEKLDRKELNITFLSNMIVSKGYLDLAKAISIYKKKYDSIIKANFIGSWPTEKDLKTFKKLIKNLGIESQINIAGPVYDRKRIKEYLLKSDAFVLPTYYPNEAQPISIIEAMNAATPIISTRHASIPDYVIDDVNGYLVDKRSPEQISEALVKLKDYENWEKKALSAREIYKNKFSPEVIKEKLITHFSDK